MYNIETFYMIPKFLFSDKYKELSPLSRLTYALLLDRYNLSLKNGWRDNDGQSYIYYPIINLAETLKINKNTVSKSLRELEAFDLIKRENQGRGKPDKIKLFISTQVNVNKNINSYNITTYDIAELEKLINS